MTWVPPKDYGAPGYGFSDAFMAALHRPGAYRGFVSGFIPGIVGLGINTLGNYFSNRGQDPSFMGPPEPSWFNGTTTTTDPYGTWDNSSWMRNGNITDPFGYNSYDSADATADSLDMQFDGFNAEARSTAQPGSGFPGGGGGGRGGGYMGNPYLSSPSMSQVDMGNGLTMPVISGPQWTGPKGLPWTYGADPASYPYSYIPPNQSWEGVNWFNLPQGSGGSAAGGGMQNTYNPGDLGFRTPGEPNRTGYGSGRSLGGAKDVNFGGGVGGGGGGTPSDWGSFSDLGPTGGYYY